MNSQPQVTLFHSPNSRSTGVLILLEELGAPYDLQVVDIKKGEQHADAFRAVNPMGKVPAVRHGDAIITEQVAIYLYLTDLYQPAGLAPQMGNPLRGPYLRWMAFYGSCFEPAMVDRALKREPAPAATSPYGDFDTMFKTLTDQLERGNYLLGERFSALDVLWGTALSWMLQFGLLPPVPAIQAYTERLNARPAFQRARAKDAQLATAQA